MNLQENINRIKEIMEINESFFNSQSNLKKGDEGLDVENLQEKLGIKVDGVFGIQTEECLKDFQRQKPFSINDTGILNLETKVKIAMFKLKVFDWDKPEFCKSDKFFNTDNKDNKNNSTPHENIIIGDSQTPYVAMNTTRASLISKTPGKSSLWEGGKTVSWLIDAVSEYPETPNVKNVVIVIGTNGGFGKFTNDNIPLLFTKLKEKFPNAKFHVVQGSWGWGGLKNITKKDVNDYYNKFRQEGANVIEPPIGEIEPHGNNPIYKIIGGKIDNYM